ncbi:carbohydrate ABC transporter permease [Paenibacillus eucommiae]|uniref:Multiple sugar transport system permease protein/raffinose/stachyose/melibiose transport system permease protein n=1 Tax=Paenibacillus eucommiae TaxID=1355755 RepID=A0ABS4IPI5_9BACL|nr:carbohydrate ABC transporter permease [Paenibacillus eucommiae]MBP1989462.1 multiple sugar transport system permease protein/raffinose/stachyose/melibiose transport system permease protein [Paenibacillus eucommiae]
MRNVTLGSGLKHVTLALLGILTVIPFVMMFLLSFKDVNQFMQHRWTLTFPLHVDNYISAWRMIHKYILNSFIISGVTVVGVIVVSCMAAYPLARMRFFLKEHIYFLIISLLMIPTVLTLVPLFSIVIRLELINSWLGLWGPYIASGQVFCIFVLRAFFASLSEEMFEAARIDGAGEARVLLSIVVPLSKPIIGTLAVLNILSSWNEYVWPIMVITDIEKQPIPVGLLYFTQKYTDYGPLFAGYVIASLPLVLLFMVASKQFVEGLSSGSIKM